MTFQVFGCEVGFPGEDLGIADEELKLLGSLLLNGRQHLPGPGICLEYQGVLFLIIALLRPLGHACLQ